MYAAPVETNMILESKKQVCLLYAGVKLMRLDATRDLDAVKQSSDHIENVNYSLHCVNYNSLLI